MPGFCLRARREEEKTRSVLLVREHLSTTNNAAIKQKTGVMKPVLDVWCHLHHKIMLLQPPRHTFF